MDTRLLVLMEWLKENDESGLQAREHANRDSMWVPDILEDSGEDYDE